MKTLTIALLILAGCGPSGVPDFIVDGVKFYNYSSSKLMQEPGLPERFHRVMVLSAKYWGHNIQEMDGWSVIIRDGSITCGMDPRQIYGGCTNPMDHTITLQVENWAPEVMTLPHEMGHVFNDDPLHINRKFREFDSLWGNIFNVGNNETSPNDPSPTMCSLNSSCLSEGLFFPYSYQNFWDEDSGLNPHL